mmetsp:Transcript_22343/g.48817  ORF Transcript_22343/g.48817 Transcript_22343/m.48817 type:complete len:219 (+) Transcript_22343:331-987(+)
MGPIMCLVPMMPVNLNWPKPYDFHLDPQPADLHGLSRQSHQSANMPGTLRPAVCLGPDEVPELPEHLGQGLVNVLLLTLSSSSSRGHSLTLSCSNAVSLLSSWLRCSGSSSSGSRLLDCSGGWHCGRAHSGRGTQGPLGSHTGAICRSCCCSSSRGCSSARGDSCRGCCLQCCAPARWHRLGQSGCCNSTCRGAAIEGGSAWGLAAVAAGRRWRSHTI